MRPSKTDYYLDIARSVAARSTCLRRQYGCVVVKNDRIVATGYNGAPSGVLSCYESGNCRRKNILHGTRYELCQAVHAEANALLQGTAAELEGSIVYLYGQETGLELAAEPCLMCKRLLINAKVQALVNSAMIWTLQDLRDDVMEGI